MVGTNLHSAAAVLQRSRRVCVLTGAGVSAESGIRTFRDTMEGLWKDFDPAKLATPEAFASDPKTVTQWYDWRRIGCINAQPNPGHNALARMEANVISAGGEFTLFTQNVDRLHTRAGSKNVIELHGSIIEWRCTVTGEIIEPAPTAFVEYPPVSPFASGALLRPDVVWFGEALPEAALNAAFEIVPKCDLFIMIGTSAQVYPAAGFVRLAADNGAFTIEVNPQATPASGIVDIALRGTGCEVLPSLIAAAWN